MNDQYKSQDSKSYAVADDTYNYLEQTSQLQVSSVLRNTYMLLALTLGFSALACYIAMALNIRYVHPIVFFAGAYGLMFLTMKLKNSIWGLASVFAFTGFMGASIAPTINFFLHTPNGANIVITALGLTAFAFFGLSAFVLITRKNMNFLGNFITVGCFVLIGAMILSFIINIPGLYLALSAGFILFSSAVILYQTSDIIHGGETNYIMATITLYVSIYNIFVSLLNILGASSD